MIFSKLYNLWLSFLECMGKDADVEVVENIQTFGII